MIGESAGRNYMRSKHQYIEQMDEKARDYSQEDDAVDLIDFYVLPRIILQHHLRKLPRK